MLVRAPNEAVSKPYQGKIDERDNPDGDLNRAHLLHLLDLIRAHPNRVAYTEKQLIKAYEERGISLCRWTLSL